ncbi:MAG: hypothetical protein LC791_13015 [Acidobacteria bacterium]|nr:hypothetical protein [Acidobacteriota bacterium]
MSTGGGRTPVWSRDGRELFFVNGMSLLSTAVHLTPTFSHGKPTTLFEGRSLLLDARTAGAGSGRMYDVSRDGRRFLMVKNMPTSTGDPAPPASMVVVQNWFEELKRLVPTN